ncbi:MAG: hypothetical protein ORN23_04010 [Chthoniobacterales bacterium]|nr:hypothetical protein [Chthoniobacterales bacterium]
MTGNNDFTSPPCSITRMQFLWGGGVALALGFLPLRNISNAFEALADRSPSASQREPVLIPEYSSEEASEKLDLWNNKHRESFRSLKQEPPLSVLLGLLLYKDRYDDPHKQDGWRDNPLNKELREFFTQNRIRRILVAVASGEAGGPIREILERELHKTGGFGPIMSQMPLHLHFRAYLKARILDCYEPVDLDSTTEGRRLKGQRRSLAACGEVNLDELLALPFQDAFRERNYDFV